MKTFFTVITFFLVVSIGNAQWTQCDGPYSGGGGTFFFSGTTFFANGGDGLYRSTDQGENWSMVKQKSGKISALVTIGSTIYVLADYKYIYMSDDNGTTWKAIHSGLNNTTVNCMAVKDNTLFVGSEQGIFSTINNGTVWTYRTSGVADRNVTALCVKGTNLFAGTINGRLYFSSDNGSNWKSASQGILPSRILFFATIGNYLFVTTTDDGIYRLKDNEIELTNISQGKFSYILSLAVIGNTLFVGDFRGLFLTADNGTTWTQIKTDTTSSRGFYALSVYGTTLYADGGGGAYGFNKTTDNGKTWSLAYYPGQRSALYSFCKSGGNIFAGTGDGVHISTNDGTNWKIANSGIENTIIWAMTANGSNIFAGSWEKGVFLSTNNGKSWKAVNNGLGNLTIFALTTVDETIIAGTKDGIYSSSDNGSNWIQTFSNLNKSMGWVVSIVANGNKIFALNDIGRIFVLSDDRKSWSQVNKEQEGLEIFTLTVGGTDLYGISYKGIYRSTDSGKEWLPDTEGLLGVKISCIAAKGGSLFAGTETGVYISTYPGAEWKPLDAISTVNLDVTLLAFNDNTLFAMTEYVTESTRREMGIWKYNTSTLDVEDEAIETPVSTLFCYPNPATGTLTIDRTSLQFPENKPVHYSLSTLIGGKVMEFDNSELKFTVSLVGMASGVYSLTAESGGNRSAVLVTVVE